MKPITRFDCWWLILIYHITHVKLLLAYLIDFILYNKRVVWEGWVVREGKNTKVGQGYIIKNKLDK